MMDEKSIYFLGNLIIGHIGGLFRDAPICISLWSKVQNDPFLLELSACVFLKIWRKEAAIILSTDNFRDRNLKAVRLTFRRDRKANVFTMSFWIISLKPR